MAHARAACRLVSNGAASATIMTMFKTLSPGNPVRKVLEPQLNYVIPFDNVLPWAGALWLRRLRSRPAGSSSNSWVSTPRGGSSSTMIPRPRWNGSASPRQPSHLASRGTSTPMVRHYLSIWDATGRYVNTCVDQAYRTDEDVRRDQELQNWIAESGTSTSRQVLQRYTWQEKRTTCVRADAAPQARERLRGLLVLREDMNSKIRSLSLDTGEAMRERARG